MKEKSLAVFENYKIRRIYDEDSETWYFSVVDIIRALIQQPDYQTARKYWNKLKERLKKEDSQSVTNRHQLKLMAKRFRCFHFWKTLKIGQCSRGGAESAEGKHERN